MKRIFSFAIISAILLGATQVITGTVQAETSAPMTEAHIARIRNNCVEAQSSLNQLHASDALLRVNRGQLYEAISTKLMAPLNSRVSLNKLDGVTLVSTTVQYEKEFDEFRANYQSYEEAMSKALDINCTEQPVAFYDSVTDAREKRQKVHDSTQAIQKTIKQYRSEVDKFSKRLPGESE